MSAKPPTSEGIITLSSRHSVPETIDRLESLLHEKNIKIFARIDQASEAEQVGLTMPPTLLLLFGNPKGGTPIMLAAPLSALDLPLKALAWQDADGNVWLSYNDPQSLAACFNVATDLIAPLHAVSRLVEQSAS